MGKRVYAEDGSYRIVGKAANGEGSVYQRSDGKWCAAVQGAVLYGHTRAEAKRKRKEALSRVEAGAPVRDSKMTLAEWMQEWTGDQGALEASKRAEKTKTLYRILSKKHIEPAPFGGIPLDRLKPSDVEKHLGITLRDKGLAESTRRNIYAVLRAALTTAKRDGLIARNPVAEVERPTVEKKEALHLSPEQLKALLKAAETSRCHTLLRFIAATAVRRGEALATTWDDLDLAAKLYRVPGTKSDSSKATLPLSDSTVAMLEVHNAVQEEEAKALEGVVIVVGGEEVPAWSDTGLVFTNDRGGAMNARNVLKEVKKAARKAGLSPATTVHTLRHSALTIMSNKGHGIKVLSNIARHADTETTGNVYLHADYDTMRAALQDLSEALG